MRKKCHGLIVFVVCVGSVLLCYFLRRKYISKNICAGGIYVLNNKLFGINNGKYVNLS